MKPTVATNKPNQIDGSDDTNALCKSWTLQLPTSKRTRILVASILFILFTTKRVRHTLIDINEDFHYAKQLNAAKHRFSSHVSAQSTANLANRTTAATAHSAGILLPPPASPSLRVNKRWDESWDMKVEERPRKSNPFDEAWWKLENTTTYGMEWERSWNLQTLFDIFPAPLKKNTIEIYNRKAHRDMIQSILSKDEIVVCASGGSTTAGGGGIPIQDRYYSIFAQYMNELLGIKMRMNHAGHGTRTSLHTANWLPHFIPPDVDLLFWEFAINDYSYTLGEGNNRKLGIEEEKNHILAWLYAVQEMKPHPPKVILVYYWKTPFQKGKDGKFDHSTFDSQAKVAAEFDFVIGHINVASYLDELNKPSCTNFRNCKTFLRDNHHASKFGHLTTSYLILNLLRGRGEWQVKDSLADAHANATRLGERTKYTWNCGNETQEKRILQKHFTDSPTGWNSPIGSWTLEVPRVEMIHSPKQLVMANKLNTTLMGKADVRRQDRVFAIDLPFCTAGLKNDNEFELFTPQGVPIKKVQTMLLWFRHHPKGQQITTLNVYLNKNISSTPGKLVDLKGWKCHWTIGDVLKSYWYIFDQVQEEVSSISACVAEGTVKRAPKLFAIAVR